MENNIPDFGAKHVVNPVVKGFRNFMLRSTALLCTVCIIVQKGKGGAKIAAL
jgi:hypothetical protein